MENNIGRNQISSREVSPRYLKRFASHEYSFGIKALYKDVYENMVVDSEKAAFDIIWRESVRNNASKSCF